MEKVARRSVFVICSPTSQSLCGKEAALEGKIGGEVVEQFRLGTSGF